MQPRLQVLSQKVKAIGNGLRDIFAEPKSSCAATCRLCGGRNAEDRDLKDRLYLRRWCDQRVGRCAELACSAGKMHASRVALGWLTTDWVGIGLGRDRCFLARAGTPIGGGSAGPEHYSRWVVSRRMAGRPHRYVDRTTATRTRSHISLFVGRALSSCLDPDGSWSSNEIPTNWT